jgi:hypothetical protein
MVRVRRAGRRGVREEPMCDSPFMRHRLETWWIWAGSGAYPSSVGAGNSRGGGHELPGRLRGRTAAYSQRGRRGIVGLLLRRANHSEHGNRLGSRPAARVQREGWGWAHRSPIGPGWGGAAVVLRAGESPCAWGRAAAVSRGEGRCNAGRRVAEWRCSTYGTDRVLDEGIGDAGQASPMGGGRSWPPVR